MVKRAVGLLERNPFWLSLFFHALLMAVYLLISMQHPVSYSEKKTAHYVPSYLSVSPSSIVSAATMAQLQHLTISHDIGLTKDMMLKKSISQLPPVAGNKRSQPVYMEGEKLQDDPLKKILSIAISRHLSYPPAAQELDRQGVVKIGFTLFPNGSLTNVQIMQSSNESMLDAAAIAAVQKMGLVDNVDVYLKEPRFLVVDVIFR